MADWVVLAVGNDARGDDALGPLLLDRVAAAAWPGVRTVLDFQFQVEHALDLDGAAGAVFVDAHRRQREPARLAPLAAATGVRAGSHALSPGEVLAVGRRLALAQPPAWLLSLRGTEFGLGTGLSPDGANSLEAGWRCLAEFFHARVGAPGGKPQIVPSGADMLESALSCAMSGGRDEEPPRSHEP